MSDLMRILQIGRNAISAHQSAMNTIGHNIANVNTPGFSRQRVSLQPGIPHITLRNIFGTGARAESVERIRSRFIDQQLFTQRPSLGQFEFVAGALRFIEGVFNEPSDSGLNKMLEDFFSAFQDLADDPESTAARQVIKERASTLAAGFNRLHGQLSNYQSDLNNELQLHVDEVNRYAEDIADLNKKISTLELGGAEASDLRDQRDLLLDKLSELVDIRTTENDNGAVSIAVGGKPLLISTKVQKLTLQASSSDGGPQILSASGGRPVELSGGKIKGLLDVRDKLIPEYLNKLDDLASTLAEEVNAVHRSGFNLLGETNVDLFAADIEGAADFAVNTQILDNPERIAASSQTNAPGDNSIALALADLRSTQTMSNGASTFGDFYNSLVTEIGSQSREASQIREGFSLTVEQLEIRRQSISGVSLDEEMVNMIESQNAFSAAARFITTVDQMTQSVLTMI